MKVLHVTSHLNVGGITRYIGALSKSLGDRGHRVIVASERGGVEAQFRAIGVTHWRLPLRTSAEFSLSVFRAIQQLSAYLREEPVDVIHAHTRVGQVVADQVSRRFHIPYVTTWHGIYKSRLGRRLWPCTGERAIAISGPVRQHLIQDFHVPQERIRHIYNGVDTSHYAIPPEAAVIRAYREQWQVPEGRPTIGGIGRLASGKVKGFDAILVAAHLLAESIPNLQVLIVGDGPRCPFLEDVARRLGIRDRVHFLGTANDIRVPLALMDVFVFPSLWPEAFGLTLVEAMAAGKPVVAVEVGAVPEIIRNGVDGLLVPPEDSIALFQEIALVLNDKAMACRMGRQAQARAREMFDIERMTTEVEAVYQEVTSRAGVRQGLPESAHPTI